ncbi:hypothetical protein KR018_002262 [Drosophila ironensis]|nr:hypothetical protein KR018_002262 [Drosophila ironensis]
MANVFSLWVVLVSLSMALGVKIKVNYVTSEEEKMNLMRLDLDLIQELNRYSDKLQAKIVKLKKTLEELQKPLKAANGSEEQYLSNPINKYSLMRQMFQDWDIVEKIMEKPVGQEEIEAIEEIRENLPYPEDLTAALQGVYRIIQTYDQQPNTFAKGQIDKVKYRGNLSVHDCYALGKFSFMTGNYQDASKWLTTASDLWHKNPRKYYEVFGITAADIRMLHARCVIAMGAVQHGRDMLMDDLGEHGNTLTHHFWNNKPKDSFNMHSFSDRDFDVLCRSASRSKTIVSKPSRLHCRYKQGAHPFQKLAPFRLEELSLKPYLVMFHSVLYDREIDALKVMSAHHLQPAQVANNGEEAPMPTRTADGAWLPHLKATEAEKGLMNRLEQRTVDFTGMQNTDLKKFQYIKYGFGGLYVPHHDYFNEKTLYSEYGDRIATILFFLNNVEHGGATAFPKLNISVPPIKGSALFWINLDRETHDYEIDTLHGGCPVIAGNKIGKSIVLIWFFKPNPYNYNYCLVVMTRWLYELDEMFRMPAVRRPRQRIFEKSITTKAV